MVRTVGLTGGIATGKSAVARLLRRRGVVVLDADEAVHALQRRGEVGLRRMVEAFGASILRPDGELDRSALARLAFGNPEVRARLEAILHPLVRERMAAAQAEAAQRGAEVVVHDIPLLFEARDPARFDATVLVYAPEAEQVRRLVRDRGLSESEARTRLDAQLPIEEKRRLATYVIENTGSLEELADAVDRVWRQVVAG